MNIIKDGRTIDTLENFRWPFLVGGEHDGESVPEGAFNGKEVVVDDTTYVRHRYLSVGAPARISYFVDAQFPTSLSSESYALHRRILNSHPDLERIDDIVWDSTGGNAKTHVPGAVDRDAERTRDERGFVSGEGSADADPASPGDGTDTLQPKQEEA